MRAHFCGSTDRRERGSSTVELVALAPLLAALMLFVVFCGRVAVTRNTVNRVARDAARSGSISLTREAAANAIEQTLSTNLGGRRSLCLYAPLDLSAIGTDTGEPGDWDSGVIEVRLTCKIPTADLGLLGIGGTKTFTAVAIEPVDVWRSRRQNS